MVFILWMSFGIPISSIQALCFCALVQSVVTQMWGVLVMSKFHNRASPHEDPYAVNECTASNMWQRFSIPSRTQLEVTLSKLTEWQVSIDSFLSWLLECWWFISCNFSESRLFLFPMSRWYINSSQNVRKTSLNMIKSDSKIITNVFISTKITEKKESKST